MSNELKAELGQLRMAMSEQAVSITKLADTMNDFAISQTKYEERQLANNERMDRLEENQKDQGRKIHDMHDAVLLNTQTVKRISWVSTVAIGSFITGSMGFMFWLVQKLVESGAQ